METLSREYIIFNTVTILLLLFLLIFNINRNFYKETEEIYNNLEQYVSPILDASKEISKTDLYLKWFQDGENESELEYVRDMSIRDTGAATLDIASTITGITYQSGGTKVKLDKNNERDQWYYSFLESDKNTSIELYYDSKTGILYIYYNVKVFDNNNLLGVVGFRVDYNNVVEVLSNHSKDKVAYLMNSQGEIYLHDDQTRIGNIDIYDTYGLLQKSDESLKSNSSEKRVYLRKTKSVPHLNSVLIVEQKIYLSTLINNVYFILLLLLVLFNIFYITKKSGFLNRKCNLKSCTMIFIILKDYVTT